MRNSPLELVPVLALALAAAALPGAVPALLPTALLPTAHACGGYQDTMPTYQGVVKSINLSRRRVVITYENAATHTFTTAAFSSWDPELIAQLKPRDRVTFGFYGADEQGRMHLAKLRVVSSPESES